MFDHITYRYAVNRSPFLTLIPLYSYEPFCLPFQFPALQPLFLFLSHPIRDARAILNIFQFNLEILEPNCLFKVRWTNLDYVFGYFWVLCFCQNSVAIIRKTAYRTLLLWGGALTPLFFNYWPDSLASWLLHWLPLSHIRNCKVSSALGQYVATVVVLPLVLGYMFLIYTIMNMLGRKISRDAFFNTIGRLNYIGFLTVTLLCILPLQCISNPSGIQTINRYRKNITRKACWPTLIEVVQSSESSQCRLQQELKLHVYRQVWWVHTYIYVYIYIYI